MGSAWAFLSSANIREIIPAPVVNAVDTTAAGDIFNGALSMAISEGIDLKEAVKFANRAAALAVTRMGAQSSVPKHEELQNYVF